MKKTMTNLLKLRYFVTGTGLAFLKNRMIDYSKNRKGFSLIELLVVITTLAILAFIGVPAYSNFTAKSSVKRAVSDLMQNARLARTLAIRDNQNYVISFNVPVNSYSIGFDANTDGVPEGFDGGPVRVVNLQNEYGANVVFGTFTGTGPLFPKTACPACNAGIGGSTATFGATAPPFEQFNPDGSVQSTGSVFITHNRANTGYTYMLAVNFQSGKFDIWKWDGEAGNPAPATPANCVNPPIQYCGWTEIR